ncbi:MAG: dUTP diphosphatase [Alkaliphilus sp.]
MNLSKIYKVQKKLDEKILMNHKLEQEELLSSKILALLVELGELANETRCFKFWSTKQASKESVILEEYVDCLHFILSIGLEIKVDQDRKMIFDGLADKKTIDKISYLGVNSDRADKLIITKQFQEVFTRISIFQQKINHENYYELLQSFIVLGSNLEFSRETITKGYMAKNRINHQRQAEGY